MRRICARSVKKRSRSWIKLQCADVPPVDRLVLVELKCEVAIAEDVILVIEDSDFASLNVDRVVLS